MGERMGAAGLAAVALYLAPLVAALLAAAARDRTQRKARRFKKESVEAVGAVLPESAPARPGRRADVPAPATGPEVPA